MKSFEEKLDQFVERGAEKYCNVEFVQLNGVGEKCYSSGSLSSLQIRPIKMPAYEAGAESLKPIVLKLESAIKEHHNLWSQGGYCMAECSILCQALAEVSKMIEGYR